MIILIPTHSWQIFDNDSELETLNPKHSRFTMLRSRQVIHSLKEGTEGRRGGGGGERVGFLGLGFRA